MLMYYSLTHSLTHPVMVLVLSPSLCHYLNSKSRHVARTCVQSFLTQLTSYLLLQIRSRQIVRHQQNNQPLGEKEPICVAFNDCYDRNIGDMAAIKTASSLTLHILHIGRDICYELSKHSLSYSLHTSCYSSLLHGIQHCLRVCKACKISHTGDPRIRKEWRAPAQDFPLLFVFLVLGIYILLKKATIFCGDVRNKLIKYATLLVLKNKKKYILRFINTHKDMLTNLLIF